MLAALAAVCLALGANPELDKAEKLIAEVRYADAARALATAWTTPANSRAEVLRILELEGIAAGTLSHPAESQQFFRKLLSLDPEHKLPTGLPPRVRTPFFEAKGSISETGPLRFEQTPPRVQGGLVESIGIKVAADPMDLSHAVRFHWRVPGGPWSSSEAALSKGEARLTVDA